MDQIDKQAVWQRVNSYTPPSAANNLRGLSLMAQEAASDYRFLMGQQVGEAAKRLWREAVDSVYALQGIAILGGEKQAKPTPISVSQQSVEAVVKRCYHRARRLSGEYTARSVDGECGIVFSALAKREQEHCAMLASLLGRIGSQ